MAYFYVKQISCPKINKVDRLAKSNYVGLEYCKLFPFHHKLFVMFCGMSTNMQITFICI